MAKKTKTKIGFWNDIALFIGLLVISGLMVTSFFNSASFEKKVEFIGQAGLMLFTVSVAFGIWIEQKYNLK